MLEGCQKQGKVSGFLDFNPQTHKCFQLPKREEGFVMLSRKKKKKRDKTTENPLQLSTTEPIGLLVSDHLTISADPSCNHDTVSHPTMTATY